MASRGELVVGVSGGRGVDHSYPARWQVRVGRRIVLHWGTWNRGKSYNVIGLRIWGTSTLVAIIYKPRLHEGSNPDSSRIHECPQSEL